MSDLKLKLEAALGKSIDMICPNNFHDPNQNHCAHFVSHMANLTFSFNCVEFKGGDTPTALYFAPRRIAKILGFPHHFHKKSLVFTTKHLKS